MDEQECPRCKMERPGMEAGEHPERSLDITGNVVAPWGESGTPLTLGGNGVMTTQTRAAPALSGSHPAELSKIYEEGIVAGLIGAAMIVIWFLILDTIEGRPLYTPTVLGTALFHGSVGLAPPETLPVSFETALMFTWVHVLFFAMIGGAAARLLRLAEKEPNYGFGILLLFVVFMLGFIVIAMVLSEAVLRTLAWPAILIGNLLAAGAMAAYFRRRHPNLTIRP